MTILEAPGAQATRTRWGLWVVQQGQRGREWRARQGRGGGVSSRARERWPLAGMVANYQEYLVVIPHLGITSLPEWRNYV